MSVLEKYGEWRCESEQQNAALVVRCCQVTIYLCSVGSLSLSLVDCLIYNNHLFSSDQSPSIWELDFYWLLRIGFTYGPATMSTEWCIDVWDTIAVVCSVALFICDMRNIICLSHLCYLLHDVHWVHQQSARTSSIRSYITSFVLCLSICSKGRGKWLDCWAVISLNVVFIPHHVYIIIFNIQKIIIRSGLSSSSLSIQIIHGFADVLFLFKYCVSEAEDVS